MRIACASDAHGAKDRLKRLIDALPRVDALCFLGDMEADGDLLEALLRERQPKALFLQVAGNNDFATALPKTVETFLGETKVLITHGHLFQVKRTMLPLLLRARERECALALFGHTHAPLDLSQDGVRLVNPGALNKGEWALIEIQGKVIVKMQTLPW